MLLAVLFCSGARAESTAEIDDVAARMQYAFYTADVRALQEVQDVLARLEVPPQSVAMKEYYLGFGDWKAAQLHEVRSRGQPSGSEARSNVVKAAQACTKHMQTAITQDARFAEAHAIEALCAGLPQSLRASGGRPTQSSCARSKGLQTALKLEPGNPRVRLVEYLCQGDTGNERAAVRFEQLQDVVAAFEAAPPSRPGRPDWGEAEALALMGEEYLRRGDNVAARNALERALVLAPDFHAAQKMLQTAAARSR